MASCGPLRRLQTVQATLVPLRTGTAPADTCTCTPVKVVLLGGPQTGGTLQEVTALINPSAHAGVELIDARELFQCEYADRWDVAKVKTFLESGGAEQVARSRQLATQSERDTILAEADVVIISWPFPLDLGARCPKLKWVHSVNAGASNMRTAPCDFWGSRTVTLTTARGHNGALPIAEYVLSAVLHTSKNFGLAGRDAARLGFSYSKYSPTLVAGKTVGIVGLGGIGVEVARLCGAVGMNVIASRRSTTHVARGVAVQGGAGGGRPATIDLLLPASELPRLLALSDFVVLCVQWTPETEGMIGATELEMMRDSAVLINVARGEVVDQHALLTALRSNKIAGAVLDVYRDEFAGPPPAELWQLPNVLITPHTSGRVDPNLTATHGRGLRLFGDELLPAFLRGSPLPNAVQWERGY